MAIPHGFVPIVNVNEIAPGEVLEVVLGDSVVAVANVDGTIHAVDNVCPHAGGPLGDGEMDGHDVICPYHGWAFDVRTGGCHVNEKLSIRTFQVRIVGDQVCVQHEVAGASAT